MLCSFGKVCRGGGKVYVQVLFEGAVSASSLGLSVRSSGPDGQSLPVKLLPCQGLPESQRVIVVPIMDVVQHVTVSSESSGEASCDVHPLRSAVDSRLNTAHGDAFTAHARNFDATAQIDEAFIELEEMIPDGAEDIVHGRLSYLVQEGSSPDARYEVMAFDRKGRRIDVAPLVYLGDSFEHPEGCPEATIRVLQFSIRVPRSARLFSIAAMSPAAPDGLHAVEAMESDTLRFTRDNLTRSAEHDPAYNDWFLDHRTSAFELDAQRRATFDEEPVFSFIVPLFRTPLHLFEQMSSSVLDQTYRRLQLVLVDASPEDDALLSAARSLAQDDPRVTVVTLEDNLGITENTNEGIKAATGDFLCFMDHDDVIEPDLLFEYVTGINAHPDTDLLYCDEDKIMDGRYCQPYFKPDFDEDLLCCSNYVCHLLTVRKSVVDGLENLPTRCFDGSQDHNMTFLVSERARNIFHARKVLYHWRINEGSTAGDSGAKPYTLNATRLSIEGHVRRRGIPAEVVESPVPCHYRLSYRFDSKPLVSIIIPNKDNVEVLDRCLRSIADKTRYENYEIVIVENNSTDEATFSFYDKVAAADDRIRIVRYEGPFNFSAICNFGAGAAGGQYLLFLNNDIEVISDGWLSALLGPCMRQDVGIVGAKLLYPDDTIQHAGVQICGAPYHTNYKLSAGDLGYFNTTSLTEQLSAVTGACLMMSRDAYDKVGGFDESFAVDYNDIDLCLRTRNAGYRIIFEPSALLYHYESVSRGGHETADEKVAFIREKARLMAEGPSFYYGPDPFYNQNLAKHRPYYCLG